VKRVRMVVARHFLDAGVERPLDRGGEYELPDVVADSLIATGVAVAVTPPDVAKSDKKSEKPDAAPAPAETDAKSQRPPETKPMRPPETKARLQVAS
jgi:hypothetical protein